MTSLHGLPEGEFRIINEETGLALTSVKGSGVRALGREDSPNQLWFVDLSGADTSSGVSKHLVCKAEDSTLGYLALTGVGPDNVTARDYEPFEQAASEANARGEEYNPDFPVWMMTTLGLIGNGSNSAPVWETEDGFLFTQGSQQYQELPADPDAPDGEVPSPDGPFGDVLSFLPANGNEGEALAFTYRGRAQAHQRWRFEAVE